MSDITDDGILHSDRLSSLVEQSKFLTKQMGVSMGAKMLYPHVIGIFSKYSADQVEKFIRVDYRLVENHCPGGLRNALRRLGPQWSDTIMQLVTPEMILQRLAEPGEWTDGDVDEAQLREMREAAAIIRETPGGMAWLEREVLDLYRIAGIIPDGAEEPSRRNGNGNL